MISAIRPLHLALGLALTLASQGPARGAYSFTSVTTPGTLASSTGASVLTFFSQSGASAQSGASTLPVSLSLLTATSSAMTAESLGGTVTDTVTINDGGQSGTLTFSATLSATGLTASGGGTFSASGITQPLASVVVNGDTYTLSNIGFGAPGTNSTIGTFTAFLSVTPAAVPEPSSLALMGLGGVALLAARRFKKSA